MANSIFTPELEVNKAGYVLHPGQYWFRSQQYIKIN